MPTTTSHLLALDLGDKRVGVALASRAALLPSPLITLVNNNDLIANLKKLVKEYGVETVVIGLPRNLSGQDSQQTTKVRETIDLISKNLDIKTVTQDEALSSVRAEEELSSHGKMFAKADIDKLAACFILEDYIKELKQ